MNELEQERITQNVRRSIGLAALRKIRRIVDEVEGEEAARIRLLRIFSRYGTAVAIVLAIWLVWYFRGR